VLPAGLILLKAKTPTPSVYTPQSIQYVLGMMISNVTTNDLNTNGVPRYVTVLGPTCEPITYQFTDNSSTGAPTGLYSASLNRLVMLDTNSVPTLTTPRHYLLRITDLTEYLYGADPEEEDYKGLVSFTTPYGRTATLIEGGIKVIRDDANSVRQISAPQCLVDVVTNSPTNYEMRFYDYNHRGTWNSSAGLYAPEADPFVKYVVYDPDSGTNSSKRTIISQIRGGQTNAYVYEYSEASAQWKLTTGSGICTELRDQVWDENHETYLKTHSFRDAQNNTAFLETRKYRAFPFGDRLVEESTGTGGDQKTVYTYYENSALTGKYGRVKTEIKAHGGWRVFDYDVQGRTIVEYASWKDLLIDQTNLAKATFYSYAPHVTNDVVSPVDTRARTVIETVGEITNSITRYAYYVDENGDRHEVMQRSCSLGSGYEDTNNLTETRVIHGQAVAHAARGRTRRVEFENGKVDTYSYEYGYYHETNAASGQYSFETDLNGDALRISVVHGTSENIDGVANKTTKEQTVYDQFQNVVLRESLVYDGSGCERIAWQTAEFDAQGREEHLYRSDGTQVDSAWGANCCGKAFEKSSSGIETVYGHDLVGRLIVETKKGTNSATDVRHTYSYDAASQQIAETLSNTNGGLVLLIASNQYDLAGRTTSSRDALGIETTFSYQSGGRISTTARAGVTNTTENYLDGRTKSVTRNGVIVSWHDYGVNADGTQWTRTYSGSAGASSPMWTTTVTDLLGRPVRQERPGFGGTVLTNTTFHNSKGWVVRQTNPGQADTLIEHNELGDQIRSGLDVDGDQVLDLAGSDRVTGSETLYRKIGSDWWQESRSVVYPNAGSSVAVTTGVSRTRLTGLSSNKTAESVSIDINGNQTTSTTAVNRGQKKVTQTVDYSDSTNNAVSVTISGLLLSSSTKTGLEYGYSYDGLERQIGVTDPRTGSSVTHYDSKGQVDYVEDATNSRTSYAYSTTTGQRIAVTNALGYATRFEFDVLGQLVRSWGHAVYPVQYSYNEQGRVVSMKTYRGGAGWSGTTWPGSLGTADETQWKYEPATGLLTNKVYADGNGTAYSYTPEGDLATRTWARGITTTYSYTNTTGDLIGINYSDSTPDVSFTYLRLGQQGTVTDGQGTRTFNYDPRLQLSNEVLEASGLYGTNVLTRLIDSQGRNAGFEFQHNGNLVAETGYGYSGVGRFDSLSWSNAGMTTARSVGNQYVSQSELLAGWTETNAGFITVREYEPHRDLLVTVSNRIGTNAVSVFGYENDPIGRRTKRYDAGTVFASLITNVFQYNTRSELTNAAMGSLLYGYRYDNIGNREWSKTNGTELTYLANQLNQYTQIADGVTNNLTYDLDGNLLTDGKWTNTWDGENRLIGVTPLSVTNGSKKLLSRYDYMGRRVRKDVLQWNGSLWQTNEIRTFSYDGWLLVSEIANTPTPSHAVTNVYTWGLDLSGSLQGAGGIGGLLSATFGGTNGASSVLYTYCANGNVSELVDTTGPNILAHYEYSPFGAVVVSEGDLADANPFQFSTKYTGSERRTIYYGYRYLDPKTGRWLCRDPLWAESDANLHSFVLNNPISAIDPSGLHTFDFKELPAKDEQAEMTGPAGDENGSTDIEKGFLHQTSCPCVDYTPPKFVVVITMILHVRIHIVAVGVGDSASGLSRTKKGYDNTMSHERNHVTAYKTAFDEYSKRYDSVKNKDWTSWAACEHEVEPIRTKIKEDFKDLQKNESARPHVGKHWDTWYETNGTNPIW